MSYDVNSSPIYSSITYKASYAGLGNSMQFASNTVAVGDINGDGFNDIFAHLGCGAKQQARSF